MKRPAVPSTNQTAIGPEFKFIGNRVSEFNFLKNNSDLASENFTRNMPYMPEVYSSQLRDRGLVLEVYGNFSGGIIDVRDNVITDMRSFIFHSDIATSNTDYKTSGNITVSHCDYLFKARDASYYELANLFVE